MSSNRIANPSDLTGNQLVRIIGPEQLDEEQIELGSDPEFWKLIEARRAQKTISRAELERRLDEADRSKADSP